MTTNVAYLDESSASSWDRTLYAFLAEKERRSGSLRTVQSYSRMLNSFFGRTSKTPDEVSSQDIFAWAYGRGLSGKEPSSITIGARLACVSSFYRFLIRMKVLASNPCEALERPRVVPSSPRGLNGEQIQRSAERHPEDAGWSARPRHHPDTGLHRPAPRRGHRHDRRQHQQRGRHLLLATAARAARPASANCRGRPTKRSASGSIASARAWRRWRPKSRYGRTREWAGASRSGTFYTNLRRYLKKAGLAAWRRSHLQALGREAAARRWRVGGGRVAVPRPQQPGDDDDLSATA